MLYDTCSPRAGELNPYFGRAMLLIEVSPDADLGLPRQTSTLTHAKTLMLGDFRLRG